MAKLDRLMQQLEAQGCDSKLVEDLREEIETMAVKDADAGILRTRKGALMVRVGGDRWPIAMYKKDWKILLSKIPLVEKALEELDILEENPDRVVRTSGSSDEEERVNRTGRWEPIRRRAS